MGYPLLPHTVSLHAEYAFRFKVWIQTLKKNKCTRHAFHSRNHAGVEIPSSRHPDECNRRASLRRRQKIRGDLLARMLRMRNRCDCPKHDPSKYSAGSRNERLAASDVPK